MIKAEIKNIQPMGFGMSLLYFAIPALVFVFGFWWLMPKLISIGMLPYFSYILGLGLPLVLLLMLSLLWIKLEARQLNWLTIQNRFRVKRMDKKAWLWSLAALLLGSVVGFFLMGLVSDWLIGLDLIPVPANLPDFLNPGLTADPRQIYNEAAGGLEGNWLLFFAMLILFFFNILGEEFWWRGVVLPRQELVFGKWTWLVHGTMWAFFHIFKWWDVLTLLPITLALSYVTSKQKNTTPGIVIHGVTNGIALIPLFLGVLGLI